MPFLPALSVVFVGVVGGKTDKVDHQVQAVAESQHVVRMTVPAATVRTLARHGEGSRELVAKLHTDGVISGELVVDHGNLSLHLVIYGADGAMKSYNEMSLAGLSLSKEELEALRSNMADEVGNLIAAAPKAPPVIVAKLEPKRATSAKNAAIADPFATAEIEMDPTPAPVATRAVPQEHEAAPVETASADAVSVAELEALTSGTDTPIDGGGGNPTTSVAASLSPQSLKLAAELGFGVASRSFSPGPATVAAYSSSPVGALRAAAHVQPTERTRLDASIEHTLSMSTPLAGGAAATTMSRWEVAGAYTLVHAAVDVRARVGLGHRSFSIASIDPARSPDGDYNYLIAGAGAVLPIGENLTLEGNLAFEPVLSGADSTEMSFGAASRWAVDAGVAAELRPVQHVFVRAALDYQRFGWSWDAGARGQGGAVDAYPTGMLSLGAQY